MPTCEGFEYLDILDVTSSCDGDVHLRVTTAQPVSMTPEEEVTFSVEVKPSEGLSYYLTATAIGEGEPFSVTGNMSLESDDFGFQVSETGFEFTLSSAILMDGSWTFRVFSWNDNERNTVSDESEFFSLPCAD